MIDSEFLKILACPNCRADLVVENDELACANRAECGLVYRVEDDIPILLVEEARPRDGSASKPDGPSGPTE